ncbi:MAG: HD domain-containing protein [Alistipes sp.]|nr:HD domain-containing protein [Alistipes sp.]
MPLRNPIFKHISRIVDSMGLEAYAVGGYVRDYYLHRPSSDIDVVVVGSGVDVAEALAKELGGAKVAVYKTYGTAMVRWRDTEVEFVGARKESYRRESRNPIVEPGTLEDDQRRSDFTINAMAWCLNGDRFGELVDPFGGMDDLDDCIIRTPCEPDKTFSDDPLRMMRAVRFASQLGFDIDEDTFDGICRQAERINIITKERIAVELNKILASPVPSIGLTLMRTSGLLKYVLPELDRMAGVERRGKHAHKDNFEHTMKVLDNVAKRSDDIWLRWAALLHDIGKPTTKAYDPRMGWTFHQHEAVGSKMIPSLFRRLRLPLNEPMRFVQKMVFLHMRPIVLSEDLVTDSAVRRLLFEAGDDVESLMLLCEADITSGIDSKVRQYLKNFELVRAKMRDLEERDRVRNFQPPITGDIIMKTYDLSPCSVVGEIKEVIKNAILDGVIPNDYDAAYQLMEQEAAKRGIAKPSL